MFVGRSSTSFTIVTTAALFCCTFLIVNNIDHVTCMSLDRLAIDRNEIEAEKQHQELQQDQEQEDYSVNPNIIVDDMELEAIPAATAGVADNTELYVLLPTDSVSEVESVAQNTIEESMPAVVDEESTSNLVDNAGDMLMMESNDMPAVMMPVNVIADAAEIESEATEVESDKLEESLPAQEVVLDVNTPVETVLIDNEIAPIQIVEEVVKNEAENDEIASMQEVVKIEEELPAADDEIAPMQEVVKNEEELPAVIADKEEDLADKDKENANILEATNEETITPLEVQEEQSEAAVQADKADADESESVDDIIANAVETVEKEIESELSTIEDLKTETDNNAETNDIAKDQEVLMETEKEKYSDEEKQDAEVESVTEAIKETKSDIIDNLTAAIDAMSPEVTVESELQAEAQTNQEVVHDEINESNDEPAKEAQTEPDMETIKGQEVSDEKLEVVSQLDDGKEPTETVEDIILETLAEINEEKTDEQANQKTEVEQMVQEDLKVEQMVQEEPKIEMLTQLDEAQEEIHLVNDKQEDNENTEQMPEEIIQNQDVEKNDTTEDLDLAIVEVPKLEEGDIQKVEEVSNTQGQEEQEVETVKQELENLNTPKEEVVAEETVDNEAETTSVDQEVVQFVEPIQEDMHTDIQDTEAQESEVQPVIIMSNIAGDAIKQDEVIAAENIVDTPMQTEEAVKFENNAETNVEFGEDKQDGILINEVAQPQETILTSENAEMPQKSDEIMPENLVSLTENVEEPHDEQKQTTSFADTVAPAIIAPTQETAEESQKTEESESTAINNDKPQLILMDDSVAAENVISIQNENVEEQQKPEQDESTSILTTIVQVPQEQPQIQTQDAVEESTPTKVENEAEAIIATEPQQFAQAAPEPALAPAVIESTTHKPLIVVDSVLNYVNASFMQQNNNKPLQDDEMFNSKLRRYDGAQVWRIVVQNDKDKKLADELQTKYDGQVWKEVKQEVDYLLKPQILAAAERHIRAANLSRIVLIDNLQKVIEVENPPADQIALLQNRKGHRLTWQAYHRLADIHDFFDYLAKTYPDICTVETIGYSIQKRPLKILKISNGNAANPGIWIDGGMHAREWISPASVTYIANQIVEGWDDLPAYMKNVNWYIHAVANPDGYEYSHTTDRLWRKNMRAHGRQCPGVDLNRNFGYKWGGKGTSANPCSQTYRGSKAFSEPETFYISKFISNFPRETFQAYLSFHSYGQYILYPWGYDYHLTKDRSDLDRVARQAGTTITKGSGVKYTVGSSATTLYPAAGGSDDWAKGIAGIKYSYTIEMGDTGRYGFVLPASFIEYNGKDGFTFVDTVARAVTQGNDSRKRSSF